MKKLSEKKIDKLIEQEYYARCNRIVIPMMEIPKIFRVGRRAYDAGLDIGDAIAAYVETIRKN